MDPLKIGALLQERYRVDAVVSVGAHEALYRVRDQRFSTDWLMRELDVARLQGPQRETATRAFNEEAAALAGLRHPGLAQVVDHFARLGDGPRAYVLTEWVDGASLAERVRAAGGGLPLDEVVDLGTKILDALYFLHTGDEPRVLGVLSPEGVWVSRDGETRLVDLGLGRHFEPRGASEAEPGGARRSHDLFDPGVDVRAAGAVLYFMATGRVPGSEAARPEQWRPDLPGGLGDVIMKALDPARSYPDAGELKHDLMAVAEGFAPDASPSAGAVASTAVDRPVAWSPERRKGCGAAAAVLILAGVLTALTLW